jgi:hypothetical protein
VRLAAAKTVTLDAAFDSPVTAAGKSRPTARHAVATRTAVVLRVRPGNMRQILP